MNKSIKCEECGKLLIEYTNGIPAVINMGNCITDYIEGSKNGYKHRVPTGLSHWLCDEHTRNSEKYTIFYPKEE